MEKGWWGEYPRLTGRTGCPNRNSTEEPVPEAGSRYRRGFSFLCACPGPVRGQGSIREGAFCPMPCIRGLAQELLSLSPGVWTERHLSIPEIFQWAFAPYPGPRLPGYFYRKRDSPARFSTGLLPHTPSLARRGIFTGRGIIPPGSAPGSCPYPGARPPVVFLPLLQERTDRSGKNPAESGF